MRNFIVLLLLPAVFYSCKFSSKEKKQESCMIKLNDTKQTVLTHEDVMEIKEWVALDSQDDAILGDISRIEAINGKYYLLDKVIQKCVLVFDEQGKFLRKIGKVGQGPGEYAQIVDFTVHKNTVTILSPQSTIYQYDLQGTFLQSKQISQSLLWNIAACNDKYLLSSAHRTYTEGENAFLLYAFDEAWNLKGKWLQVLPKQMPTLPLISATMQSARGKLFYCDVFTNAVYQFDSKNNKVSTAYALSFLAPVPQHVYADVMSFMQRQREYDFLHEAVINEKYALFCHAHQGDYNLAVADSEGNLLKNGRFQGRFPKTFHGQGEELVSTVSANEYLTYWKEQPIVQCKDSIAEEDNFLLLKWTVKQ